MPQFQDYIAQGYGWLFFPMAIVLGAFHGLEPGHSKSMMTAFIVGIRGSVWQAMLLGISVTISHTLIIWILAFIGLHYGSHMNIEHVEPYFQIASGIFVMVLACWILIRTLLNKREACHHEANHLASQKNNQHVTTGQIILFGFTGGLLPCPAAFAILLVCLQLKKVALGFAIVVGFSLGLAITLVSIGILAALSVKYSSERFKRFSTFTRYIPYISPLILIVIGFLLIMQGSMHVKLQ